MTDFSRNISFFHMLQWYSEYKFLDWLPGNAIRPKKTNTRVSTNPTDPMF